MTGCSCGWPIDSCNPKFAEGGPCGKEAHEARVETEAVRSGLENQAEAHEAKAGFLRRAIDQLPNEEGEG